MFLFVSVVTFRILVNIIYFKRISGRLGHSCWSIRNGRANCDPSHIWDGHVSVIQEVGSVPSWSADQTQPVVQRCGPFFLDVVLKFLLAFNLDCQHFSLISRRFCAPANSVFLAWRWDTLLGTLCEKWSSNASAIILLSQRFDIFYSSLANNQRFGVNFNCASVSTFFLFFVNNCIFQRRAEGSRIVRIYE